MTRLASFREPADRLLASHGFPLPPADMPPLLASHYRAVAFLAWRVEEFADLVGGWTEWSRVIAAGEELANAVWLAEAQFAREEFVVIRRRWAARRRGRPCPHWGRDFPEPLAAALWTARRVLHFLHMEPRLPSEAAPAEKPSPFIMRVVSTPPAPPPWNEDDDVEDDMPPSWEAEQARYLFRGRPEPWIVNGTPLGEDDMRMFLGEWRDGARPPEPSPLVREAWQDLSAWTDDWQREGGAPCLDAPAVSAAGGGDAPALPPAPTGDDRGTISANREAHSSRAFAAPAPAEQLTPRRVARPRRITFMVGSRCRWFMSNEAERHGTNSELDGPYAPQDETLFRLPDGTWVLWTEVYAGPGLTDARALTDDEALAWLDAHVLDKRKPWPEPYRALADARHAGALGGSDGAALGDGDKSLPSPACTAPPPAERTEPLDAPAVAGKLPESFGRAPPNRPENRGGGRGRSQKGARPVPDPPPPPFPGGDKAIIGQPDVPAGLPAEIAHATKAALACLWGVEIITTFWELEEAPERPQGAWRDQCDIAHRTLCCKAFDEFQAKLPTWRSAIAPVAARLTASRSAIVEMASWHSANAHQLALDMAQAILWWWALARTAALESPACAGGQGSEMPSQASNPEQLRAALVEPVDPRDSRVWHRARDLARDASLPPIKRVWAEIEAEAAWAAARATGRNPAPASGLQPPSETWLSPEGGSDPLEPRRVPRVRLGAGHHALGPLTISVAEHGSATVDLGALLHDAQALGRAEGVQEGVQELARLAQEKIAADRPPAPPAPAGDDRRGENDLAAGSGTKGTAEYEPDGPFGSDGFRFGGVEVRFGRAAKQRALVLALWDSANGRPHPPRGIEDVLTDVYGEENDTGDATFRQLCSDVRRRLQGENFPLTLENLQGKVSLKPQPA